MLLDYKYYNKLGWNKNPFVLSVLPDLMVGYASQADLLLSHIMNQHKIALVIGPTGSGKTTFLNWTMKTVRNNDFSLYYIPKPPTKKEDMIDLFKFIFGYSVIDNIFFPHLNILNIQKYLLNKISKKNVVLLIDESHESSVEVLEWFRTLSDIIPNLTLVFAGLPILEKKLETDLSTLIMRINTRVYLQSLNVTETDSLIRKRIENAGGKGLEPFSPECINKIHDITGGFPREIIKVCDDLLRESIKRNISIITSQFIDEVYKTSIPSEMAQSKILITSKQKEILELLNKQTDLSPTDIVNVIGIESYKTKYHAIRSVNNILKRLMDDDIIKRKQLGNSYVYYLSGKGKTLFVDA